MRTQFTTTLALAVLLLTFQRQLAAQWMPPRTIAYPVAYGYPTPTPAYQEGSAPISMGRVTDAPPERPAIEMSGCACGAGCDSGMGCQLRGGCDRRFGACGCGRCRRMGPFDEVFGSVEYMNWYNKGIHLPPLVTTSPNGTPQLQAGVLPNATVLFGNTDIEDDYRSGGRVTFGMWTDQCHNLGLGGKIYGVESGAVRFNQNAAGNPILARPFFNVDPIANREDALLISFPGVATGSIDASASVDIWGSEVFLRSLLDHGRNYRLDLIAGWQFNRIDSTLSINSRHVAGANTFNFSDVFDVDNTYNAGVLGLYTEIYQDCLTISATGKIGIGAMNQQVLINGINSVTAGAATVTTAGGFLALPTNMGTFETDVLAWSPEFNFKLNYAMSERVAVTVGYTFLYWTNVAFAGDQVDRAINPTQLNGGGLVGPARPAFAFRDTDFWVQSIDLGLSLNY